MHKCLPKRSGRCMRVNAAFMLNPDWRICWTFLEHLVKLTFLFWVLIIVIKYTLKTVPNYIWFSQFFFSFEAESHHVTPCVGWPRPQRPSCLCFASAGIKGVDSQAEWFYCLIWRLSSLNCWCEIRYKFGNNRVTWKANFFYYTTVYVEGN